MPKAGDRCYAVLAEDGEWHEAVVERLIDARDSAPAPTVAVRFTEYGKVQEVELGSIQATGHDASSDDEVDMVGACELCGRVDIALTRHHLIPRRTHAKYKKRGVSSKELEVSAYICRCDAGCPGRSSSRPLGQLTICIDYKIITTFVAITHVGGIVLLWDRRMANSPIIPCGDAGHATVRCTRPRTNSRWRTSTTPWSFC